jgi:hypothetical protein
MVGDRIPVWARFSTPVQTNPGAYPASYTMGIGSLSWGVKWSGCGINHPPPSSTEVKERVDLYFHSPSGFYGLFWSELYLFPTWTMFFHCQLCVLGSLYEARVTETSFRMPMDEGIATEKKYCKCLYRSPIGQCNPPEKTSLGCCLNHCTKAASTLLSHVNVWPLTASFNVLMMWKWLDSASGLCVGCMSASHCMEFCCSCTLWGWKQSCRRMLPFVFDVRIQILKSSTVLDSFMSLHGLKCQIMQSISCEF